MTLTATATSFVPASLDAQLADAVGTPAGAASLFVGACGSGRTSALMRLRDQLGGSRCQYLDVECSATTPERFLRALVGGSPFALTNRALYEAPPATAREAFDATLVFLNTAKTRDGGIATFLLDEVLELRTFESFPGLRTVMSDLLTAIAHSDNHFVMTTRYRARARKLLREAAAPVALVDAAPFTPADVLSLVEAEAQHLMDRNGAETASAIHALTHGHPAHTRAIVRALSSLPAADVSDPVGALASQFSSGGAIAVACHFTYELRLHRARGYGALKAILDVLAEEEPLTLTAIAQRLQRTPGSTKDYLSWLEDVDLVHVERKRYRVADPLLRLWIRLYARPVPPSEDDVAREVQRYAATCLAQMTNDAPPAKTEDDRARPSTPVGDIIEFD